MKPSDSDNTTESAKSPSEPPINTIEGVFIDLRSAINNNPDTSNYVHTEDDEAFDRAEQAINHLITQALIDEFGKALESGDGETWDKQMSGTVGYVGRRYMELKGLQNEQ